MSKPIYLKKYAQEHTTESDCLILLIACMSWKVCQYFLLKGLRTLNMKRKYVVVVVVVVVVDDDDDDFIEHF